MPIATSIPTRNGMIMIEVWKPPLAPSMKASYTLTRR